MKIRKVLYQFGGVFFGWSLTSLLLIYWVLPNRLFSPKVITPCILLGLLGIVRKIALENIFEFVAKEDER